MASSKVWFITGTSSGFGRVWTEAALKRGDKVVATARDTEELHELVSDLWRCDSRPTARRDGSSMPCLKRSAKRTGILGASTLS